MNHILENLDSSVFTEAASTGTEDESEVDQDVTADGTSEELNREEVTGEELNGDEVMMEEREMNDAIVKLGGTG